MRMSRYRWGAGSPSPWMRTRQPAYRWNVPSSVGLQYLNETYIAPETELVGAGGVHRWQYVAAEPGSAEFIAIYWRPWEEVTGNETTFSMDFIIR